MLGGSIPMLESILYTFLGLIIGGALGFYFTKKKFEKELRENPPINEKIDSCNVFYKWDVNHLRHRSNRS